MRLTSLYIGQYKNLRDFSLKFDGGSFIDVFVGKNGTGKSRRFEAPSQIFCRVIRSKCRAGAPVGEVAS
ncbi:MAG: hypothetical protein Tsb0017_21010 [Geothermobacteraceae bacterium]